MELFNMDELSRKMCERCNKERSEEPCEPSECFVRQIMKSAPAVKTESKWISVKDKLPPVGERVLICDNSYGQNNALFPYMSVWSLEKMNGGLIWEDNDGVRYGPSEATHWMPLPVPPKKVEE